MSFCNDDDKPLAYGVMYKSTWSRIEELKGVRLITLLVHNGKHIKTNKRMIRKLVLTFMT